MVMCAIVVRSGKNTVGDFVMVTAMMIQLYQPLKISWAGLSRYHACVMHIEKMFDVLGRAIPSIMIARRQPLIVTSGNGAFDDVRFSYDPSVKSLPNASVFRGARRQYGGELSGRPRRRQSTPRSFCSASMMSSVAGS